MTAPHDIAGPRDSRDALTIVGAGPSGTLLALLLARQGRRVRVFERRPDPRTLPEENGRSINLALAARGIAPLRAAGVFDAIAAEMVAMPGRMLHELDGSTRFIPYGDNADEVIHALSRARLNRLLIEAAAHEPLIELHFLQRCVGANPDAGALTLRDEQTEREYTINVSTVFGADGAGSGLRGALARRGLLIEREEPLDHDYKELTIPARSDAQAPMHKHALHIWPRGGHMLIALPNADASFTATLFLPRKGPVSFEALGTDIGRVDAFFAAQFPDAAALIPDLAEQWRSHPQGYLATLYCWPWHAGRMLLVGDAAHAIVPFHGQGLNCGFEDCAQLAALIAAGGNHEDVLARFEQQRRVNADAIAQMALENYVEMRDTVRHSDFALRKELSTELQARYSGRFIPRYSMVMFHDEIPYAEALRRGHVQERILDALIARDIAHIEQQPEVVDTLLREAGLLD